MNSLKIILLIAISFLFTACHYHHPHATAVYHSPMPITTYEYVPVVKYKYVPAYSCGPYHYCN